MSFFLCPRGKETLSLEIGMLEFLEAMLLGLRNVEECNELMYLENYR